MAIFDELLSELQSREPAVKPSPKIEKAPVEKREQVERLSRSDQEDADYCQWLESIRIGRDPGAVKVVPGQCRRCRSRDSKPVPIHGGLSIRLDCAKCGAFIEFLEWQGQRDLVAKIERVMG